MVAQSTHVTSRAVLALRQVGDHPEPVHRGVRWLLAESGAGAPWWVRAARTAMRIHASGSDGAGWPWFPGSAAWVVPTSLAICAMARHRQGPHAGPIATRVQQAAQFLLSRRCPDHGWNHGGLFAPGERPASYPETTGVALLALGAMRLAEAPSDLESSIRRGEHHARQPMSTEGASWLRLGLLAHGRSVAPAPSDCSDWTVSQIALRAIAECATRGHNPFMGTAR